MGGGARPLGYHAVNVALHGIVAVLAFVLLRRLGVPGALLGAFIFALHPVHVELAALGDDAGLRQATDEILRRAPGHAEARALRDGRAHREP